VSDPSVNEARRPPEHVARSARQPGEPAWVTFDRHLFHFGWLFGAVGAIAAFPFVVTHPHLPPGDPEGVIHTVLDFKAWLLIHLGLMFVLPMMLIGLLAIARSIRDERTSASAAAAMVIAVVGTIFGILGQGVDGVGFNIAADVYEASRPEDKGAAVLMSVGVSGVAVGIFLLVLFFYFGFTSVAFGLVFLRTRGYPKAIAALALLGGALGLAAAFITYFDDFSDFVYYGLFIPAAVVFLLWVLAASVHLWLTQVRPHRRDRGTADAVPAVPS
jgi:hypothetical protein